MKYKKTQIQTGEIVGLFICNQANSLESEAVLSIEVNETGIIGDKHQGVMRKSGGREMADYPRGTIIRNNRQWSAISEEELAIIAQNMKLLNLKPEWLGANIVVKGISNFTQLPPMSKLIINDSVVLINYYENFPCYGPHQRIVHHIGYEPDVGFVKAGLQKRGLVGWIEKAGIIMIGDKIEVLIPA
jgi:hypothetical protein